MNFFVWGKNIGSFSRYLDFLSFCEIYRFQNLWHHIRNDLCFNIKNIFSNSIEHVFFEILIPKVKPIAIRIFYRHPNENDFLNVFSNEFQQIDSKTNEIYFLGDFNTNLFKMENLSSKKISHINLKVPVLP